jgi:Protein of unknown function (DUF1822)
MTFNQSLASLAQMTHLWLEFTELETANAWQQTEQFSTANSRWNAYLNRLCLDILLPWLRDEYAPEAEVFPNTTSLPSLWEITNGTSINCNVGKIVIIPTEAIDLSEFRIPQEWVDIPTLTADYYLAVQVEPDDGWLRVWGYTTHAQVKEKAIYDASDRTYSLSVEDIFTDVNVLWVARQLCPDEIIRTEVAQLPQLSVTQADNLLQRLGNPDLIAPRMAVPFATWGALIEHGAWRQRLYEQRQGMPEQWSVAKWMQSGVSDFARNLGWGRMEIQPSFAGARGSEVATPVTVLVRELTIDGGKYELRVLPKDNSEGNIWRFELWNAVSGENIPAGVKLQLLTEDLQPFDNNQDIATAPVKELYIEVALSAGEGLVWNIEPAPQGYQQEILRF